MSECKQHNEPRQTHHWLCDCGVLRDHGVLPKTTRRSAHPTRPLVAVDPDDTAVYRLQGCLHVEAQHNDVLFRPP